jgi:DNA-binding NtrC family response regulator
MGSRSLAEVEREHIDELLRQTGGRSGEAAAILGIRTATLWRRRNARSQSERS